MEKPLTIITAYDTVGNTFEITVTLKHEVGNSPILCFGGPMQWRVSTLKRDYPFERPFCIDLDGKMHYGKPVCVSADDMNAIMKAAGVKG